MAGSPLRFLTKKNWLLVKTNWFSIGCGLICPSIVLSLTLLPFIIMVVSNPVIGSGEITPFDTLNKTTSKLTCWEYSVDKGIHNVPCTTNNSERYIIEYSTIYETGLETHEIVAISKIEGYNMLFELLTGLLPIGVNIFMTVIHDLLHEERDSGILESLKLFGLKKSSYYLSVVIFISSLVTINAALTSAAFYGFSNFLIPITNPLWFLYYLTGLMSELFFAILVGVFVRSTPVLQILLLGIFFARRLITKIPPSLVVILFSNLESSKPTILIFVGLCILTALSFMFYVYFDLILPRKQGSRLHPLFFLRKTGQKRNIVVGEVSDVEMDSALVREPYSEQDLKMIQEGDCVSIQSVTKVFGDSFKAVDNVSFALFKNEVNVLLGQNGAGKTTLTNLICGMYEMTSGSVSVLGKPVGEQMLGFCSQETMAWNKLSLRDNLELVASLSSTLTGKKLRKSMQDLLHELALTTSAATAAGVLSGGQKRRLAVAMALAGDCNVVLLDEPTSGVDPFSRRDIWSVLKSRKVNKVICLSTHFLDEAEILADRVSIMADGKLAAFGTTSFLKTSFNCGYKIQLENLQTADSSSFQQDLTTRFGATVIESGDSHLTVMLPGSVNISDCIESVKFRLKETGFGDVSFRPANLEDVLTKVTNVPEPASIQDLLNQARHSSVFSQILAMTMWNIKGMIRNWSTLVLSAGAPIIVACTVYFVDSSITSQDISVLICFGFFACLFVILYIFTYNLSQQRDLVNQSGAKKYRYSSGLSIGAFCLSEFATELISLSIPIASFLFSITLLFKNDWNWFSLFMLSLNIFCISFTAIAVTLSFSNIFGSFITKYILMAFFHIPCVLSIVTVKQMVILDHNTRGQILQNHSIFFTTTLDSVKTNYVYCYLFPILSLYELLVESVLNSATSITFERRITYYPNINVLNTLTIKAVSMPLKSATSINYVHLFAFISGSVFYLVYYFFEMMEHLPQYRNMCSCGRRKKRTPKESVVPDEEKGLLSDSKHAMVVDDLYKSYGAKKAVSGTTFHVEFGEIFVLLGINGAGKTTTFKMCLGEEAADSGAVSIDGLDMERNTSECRKIMGYCPQSDFLAPEFTVREHMELFARIRGVVNVKTEVDALLELLLLKKFENQKPLELSGGTKRKLCVSMAVVGRPKVLFLDEPSSGLDPVARRYLWKVIKSLTVDKKTAVVLTTHVMEEAEALCSRLGVMAKGKMLCEGTLNQVRNQFTKGFEVSLFACTVNFSEIEEAINEIGSDSISKSRIMSIMELSLEDYAKEFSTMESMESPVFAVRLVEYRRNQEIHNWAKTVLPGTVQLIEIYGNAIKVAVTEINDPVEIFKAIEANKKDNIQEFTVSQYSLEHIFNLIAETNK